MANEEAPKTWGKTEVGVELGENPRTVGPMTEVINEYKAHLDKAIRRGREVTQYGYFSRVIDCLEKFNAV